MKKNLIVKKVNCDLVKFNYSKINIIFKILILKYDYIFKNQ